MSWCRSQHIEEKMSPNFHSLAPSYGRGNRWEPIPGRYCKVGVIVNPKLQCRTVRYKYRPFFWFMQTHKVPRLLVQRSTTLTTMTAPPVRRRGDRLLVPAPNFAVPDRTRHIDWPTRIAKQRLYSSFDSGQRIIARAHSPACSLCLWLCSHKCLSTKQPVLFRTG